MQSKKTTYADILDAAIIKERQTIRCKKFRAVIEWVLYGALVIEVIALIIFVALVF